MAESLRRTRPGTIILILLLAFTGGLCATWAAARSRTDPYRGVYRQSVVSVVSETSGTIDALARERGDVVQPGETLAKITAAPSGESLAARRARIEELEESLAAARDEAAMKLALENERIEEDRLRTRLRYADLLRARLDTRTRERMLREQSGGGSSIVTTSGDASVDGAKGSSLENESLRLELAEVVNRQDVLQTQIQLCEDRLNQLERLQADLPETIQDSCGVERLAGRLEELRATHETERESRRTIEIAGEAHGRLGVWRAEKGDRVWAGQTLVEIFDAERPFVLLHVGVSKLPELTAGGEVRVEFEGFATRKPLYGTVRAVRSEAERNAESASVPGATAARVEIVPSGRRWPTPPLGTTARVYLE